MAFVNQIRPVSNALVLYCVAIGMGESVKQHNTWLFWHMLAAFICWQIAEGHWIIKWKWPMRLWTWVRRDRG